MTALVDTIRPATERCGQRITFSRVAHPELPFWCWHCRSWSSEPCHWCNCTACEPYLPHDRTRATAPPDRPEAEDAAEPDRAAPGVALGPAQPAPLPAPPAGERSPKARQGGKRATVIPRQQPEPNPLVPRRSRPGQLALFGRQPALFSEATVTAARREPCAHCDRVAFMRKAGIPLCVQHVTGRLPAEAKRALSARGGGASNTPPQYATKLSKGRKRRGAP